MKSFIVNLVILILIVTTEAESARIRRNESKKKSNLAVMLAYKPNSEIRTKDEHDNMWTYRITDDDRDGCEDLNKKLLDILVKQKFGNFDEKAINKKRHAHSSSCESSETIDDAKVVEVNKQSDKNSCYKNTYKNVLNAFEEALKSQIQSYKKCVCQKKQQTTTTTTTTSTTSTTIAPRAASESEEEDGYHLNNEHEVASAADNSSDVICFHKQYAFMLQKLLDTIPSCKKGEKSEILPSDLEEYQGEQSKRHERHNARDLTPLESAENSVKNDDELKDQIVDVLKEYLNVKKRENVKQTTTTTTTTTQSPKIIDSEEIINEEKFFEKLRKLFKQLESDDETFPVSSNKTAHTEPATSVSSSKPPKKSSAKASVSKSTPNDSKARKSRRTEINSTELRRRAAVRRVVAEHSDESTETSIKLKKGKFEKKHSASEELSRGDQAKGSKLSKQSVHTKSNSKSYRSAPRTSVHTTTVYTPTTTSSTYSSKHSEYRSSEEEESNQEVSEETSRGRNADDDRLATDLAKAISDLAKKYLK